MDTRTRKLAGWVIVAIGVAIALVGAFADTFGLGGEGTDEVGGKQIAALVVGLLIALVGLAMALLPLGEKASPTVD